VRPSRTFVVNPERASHVRVSSTLADPRIMSCVPHQLRRRDEHARKQEGAHVELESF
jgi:hypothetical protein